MQGATYHLARILARTSVASASHDVTTPHSSSAIAIFALPAPSTAIASIASIAVRVKVSAAIIEST